MATELGSVGTLIESAHAAESAGDWDEAISLYESALEASADAEDPVRSAELLRCIGRVHFERGAYDRASELYQASLATAQAAGLHQETAAALNGIASTAQMRGRLDVAESLYGQAERLAQDAGDPRLAAAVYQNMGTLAGMRGRVPEALERFRRSAELLRELGDKQSAARAFNNLGMVAVDVQDWGVAEVSYAAARELAEQAADPRNLGRVHVNRAERYILRRDHEAAREECDAAHAIFSRLGSEIGLAEVHKLYGALFRELGQPRRSEVELKLALRLAQSCGNQLLEAEVEDETARLEVVQGRTREALQSLNRAFKLFEQTEARRELMDVQRRLDRLEETYFRTLQLMEFESVESTNPATVGRYQRVADLACRLAALLGCTGKELTWLRIGAYLYDVGKASLAPELLNKAGPLNEQEEAEVRRHPVVGEQIVAGLDFPAQVRALVRHHHERWDGQGYPDGLKGADIPLHARIVAIADAFDALTSDRSYRPAVSTAEALRTMLADAGTVFDPELLRLLPALVSPASAQP